MLKQNRKANNLNMRHWLVCAGLSIFILAGCHPALSSGAPLTEEEYSTFAQVPIYPNAILSGNERQVPERGIGGAMVYKMEFDTNDPVESVRRFYREQLRMDAVGNQEAWNISGKTKGGNEVMIQMVRTEEGSHVRIESASKELPRR